MEKNLRREFTVKPPIVYDAYPLTAPEGEVHEKARKLRAQMLAGPLPAKPKSAVWIVHGIGEQVPFATLEQAAEGIIMAAGDAHVVNVQYREVKVDKTVLQRVELTLQDGNVQRQVDVYEYYWAPKTEGAVKLSEVIGFLWDGGSRGLINFFSHFQRALFGAMASFKLTWRTPTYLLVTLLTLAALIVINAIIIATGATIAGISTKLPAPELVTPLTVMAGLVSAAAITFGVVLMIAAASKPAKSKSFWGHALRNLTWLGVAFTILSIITGASVMAVIFWKGWNPVWLNEGALCLQTLSNVLIFLSLLFALSSQLWRRLKVSRAERAETSWVSQAFFYFAFIVHLAVLVGAVLVCASLVAPDFRDSVLGRIALGLQQWSRTVGSATLGSKVYGGVSKFFQWGGWVWPFLAIVSAQVRKILVEYVGDVTAYVASNKVDRFDDLRAKIKTLAKESVSAIYSAKTPGVDQFEYDKVCVVGHSLGSVIAYDTLNRLIADDMLTGNPAHVVDRTSALLTFGSPLDKTAFFFSVMGENTRHIREQLAAVVQPLIEYRDIRDKIEWVNVFSRNDIVSGSLDFYEFPEPPPAGVAQVKRVVNVKDEDALVPLVAHIEYWTNLTVWNELLERV
jgi:hypothetical protein